MSKADLSPERLCKLCSKCSLLKSVQGLSQSVGYEWAEVAMRDVS